MKYLVIIIAATVVQMRSAEPYQDWKKVEESRAQWNQMPEAEIKAKAEGGDPIAKYFYRVKLVLMHETSDQEKFNLSTKFLNEAKEAGVPQAMFEHAGQMRESKEFIPELEAAAKTGFPPAELEVAYQLLEGTRAAVDESRAVELVQKAADAGYANAEFELAEMYASGMGDPRSSEEKPMKLYERAAIKGHGEAMAELAWRYRNGYGTEKDFLEAARWTWRASQYGARSNKEIGGGYSQPASDGDSKLFDEFYSIYVSAVTSKDPAAMYKAGKAFLDGELGKKNFKSAYAWLSLAAKGGYSGATPLAAEARKSLKPEEASEIDLEIARMQAEEAAARRNKK